MLALTVGSTVESVAGVLRDGEVHHESAATAAAHAGRSAGEHGHEDAGSAGDHEHGPEHQHGTANDHCTHTHGMAPPASFAFDLPVTLIVLSYSEPVTHTGTESHPLFHPPKA